MRVALDTNVLAYAEGVNGAAMQETALELIQGLPRESALVPVQALGELFNLLVRKAGWTRPTARAAILSWGDSFASIETTPAVMFAAADVSADHQLSIWDAVILAAAAAAGCRLLLSQDMHEGFTWNGVTITNPFAGSRHPLLKALLGDEAGL
ncbi:MAG TPA: PIN domain-containing protein [Candidatus Acidoferrum sp.]|nr:PIN domain-containing protein [Candidatus Acidoferrum sp.]